MSDLLELENLVANTAYLEAQRVNCSELRNKRFSLSLPRLKNSSALLLSVGSQYESLCEQQPIGRKLFQQFLLASHPQYVAAAEFLEELSHWSIAEDETREKAKRSILTKFCRPESRSFLSFLTGEAAEKCKDLSDKNFDEVTVGQLREATRDFLMGKPFSEYQKSPFFYRFLQWKEFEKQTITRKYFYEFRILGKGGFGEVCTPSLSTNIVKLYPLEANANLTLTLLCNRVCTDLMILSNCSVCLSLSSYIERGQLIKNNAALSAGVCCAG